MENQELVKKINEEGQENKEEAVEEKTVKFLVFRIGEKQYALHAEQVREIVMDVPLFYVPFVPPYVRGFINRHGEPYTVFDVQVLFEQQELEGETFLILNLDDDQLAFLITDIVEICKTPESAVHSITAADEHEGYFYGSITSRDMETFILNLGNIIGKLENDIEVG